MMSTHKITAGHGYTYLTSQVAAQDGTAVARGSLGAYYSERGEAPGRWMGTGLGGLGISAGSPVSEAHMVALFGEGRHPDASRITAELRAAGAGDHAVGAAIALGTPFELNLANNEYFRAVGQLMVEWNRAHGYNDCAPVPPQVKARIRTAVGQELFAERYGREAADAYELSSFVASRSRVGSRVVAGYDLTFSPVKSVSALWALASEDVIRQVEAAHDAAVTDTIRWLEREAAYTRLGRDGIRQVDVRGLVAVAFVHRTSRSGDPDLHTHVAVSNKVQTFDGRWRALDGRVLFKATVAASERYNTRLEAELRERLGVEFEERVRPGRRPVREIVGIDERLLEMWSSRRAAIDIRREELAATFQREHGRPPTPVEGIELAQQATLETRPVKHEPASERAERQRWHAEAERKLGGATVSVATDRAARSAPARGLASTDVRDIAERVVERVQADRATWQRWHILAEAHRELRRLAVPVDLLEARLDEIVAVALSEHSVALTRPDADGEPEPLRRGDGSSVYVVAGSQLYTSPAVLAAERTVLAAATRADGYRVDERCTDMALLESAANGLVLNDGQARFVRELARSGARCQLALAPAGTGKTTALRVLARAWADAGGDVLALAPSAAAARVLAEATDLPAETLAKALVELRPGGTMRLGSRTLIVLDEAGMASTPDLARLVGQAVAAGASVRLIGDDRQLAAIGAGGLLRDLAETTASISLTEAVRFADPAEAAAAAAIRDGSVDGLDFYATAGRIRVGDEQTAGRSAYEAWAADRAAGRDSLLLAGTRRQVTTLNARARADRLAQEPGPVGREVRLADGCGLSAGDAIITRHNDRGLAITATDWVKNGDRWTVATVHATGNVTAVHRDTGRRVVLPAGYVAEDVCLGYAMTIHAAQGSTAGTCHTVITGAETREQLYVALTRGRHANYVHVALPGASDEHAPIRPDTLRPPTALDLLRRVLDRESSARSATTESRAFTNPAQQLGDAVARYTDALAVAPTSRDQPPAGPAPLPWLPPVPKCAEERWRAYLSSRAEQIVDLADAVMLDVHSATGSAGAGYRRDPMLAGHRVLWAATHAAGEEGAPLSARERLYMHHLRARSAVAGGAAPPSETNRWLPLVAAIDRHAIEARDFRVLVRQLSRAFRCGLDVDRLLPNLLHHGTCGGAATTLAAMTADRDGSPGSPDIVHRLPHALSSDRLYPTAALPAARYDPPTH